MKVAGLSWTPFRLPLRAPFVTATGETAQREGLILRLKTDTGIVGLGEASPHPAAGTEATREIEVTLAQVAPSLVGADVANLHSTCPDAPSALRCALDVAACDALARDRGISVARLLSDRARSEVAVNATVSARSNAAAASDAKRAREAGFACVKLKVGMAESVAEERQRVSAVREAIGPEVKLRIDANGAWDVDRAVNTIQALEEYDLEFVEQPVPPGTLEGMRAVQSAVRVPIAADEDVTGPNAAQRIVETGAARVLVVKPMVVGGLRPACRIAELASAAGVALVVTTTIDSGVGTAAALHLAAALPSKGPACGLATGSLLAGDLVAQPLLVRDGRMPIPAGPGIGVELDEAKLARYAP